MAAVQDRAHTGNGLTDDPRRGACSGRSVRSIDADLTLVFIR
jgi:hypothetical protein